MWSSVKFRMAIRPGLERLCDVAAAGVWTACTSTLRIAWLLNMLLVDEQRHCGVELVFLNRRIGTCPKRTYCCRFMAWRRSTGVPRSWNVAVAASDMRHVAGMSMFSAARPTAIAA